MAYAVALSARTLSGEVYAPSTDDPRRVILGRSYPFGMSASVRIAALDLRVNRGVYLAAVAVGAT